MQQPRVRAQRATLGSGATLMSKPAKRAADNVLTMTVDELQLKRLIKTTVAETLVEQRDFLKEIVEEVVEDIALSRAI